MKRSNNIQTGLLALFMIMLFVACDKNENVPVEPDKDARLSLSFTARAATDGLVKGDDGKFSSLAIYVFNQSDGTCEFTEFLPDITPEAISEYRRVVSVSALPKIVYAVGNYEGTDKSLSITLDKNTTMKMLDEMMVTSNSFPGGSVLMIGRKEVKINGSLTEAEIPMKRLVARLDVYVFKNNDLKDDDVQLVSLEFVNQVMNSRCEYQGRNMISPVVTNRESRMITTNTTLQNMPSDVSVIVPENAHASFYSYQNIAASVEKDDQITPYLLATIKINGKEFTYKGYITDNGQISDKYSLNQNTVYRIIAMFEHPDNELFLKIIPLPWTVSESQIGGQVTDGDYVFDAYGGNDTGATTGIVYFPYVKDNVPVSGTSYASYSFKLTAPAGAVWTATITNGLEFFFNNESTNGGPVAISKGIAGEKECLIQVGATKSWSGVKRSTYMYITVDGEKLKINPLQGTTRRFPGDNDTDILITQVGYQ